MADQGWSAPGLESAAIKRKSFAFRVKVTVSATEGSVTAQVLNCPDASARVYLSSQSATAPSEANFSGLTSSAAPSVFGFVVDCGDARFLHDVSVPTNSIKSASMTAGVVTNKGAAHAVTGNTGVTSAKDLAFQVSCTACQFTLTAPGNHEFDVIGSYSAE